MDLLGMTSGKMQIETLRPTDPRRSEWGQQRGRRPSRAQEAFLKAFGSLG